MTRTADTSTISRVCRRPKRVASAVLVLLAAAPAFAADTQATAAPTPIVRYNLGPWEGDIGYAQAVRTGQLLFVSGTVGRGDLEDPEGMQNALRGAYDRVRQTLEAHGIGFDRVVKETVYTVDIERLKAAGATRREYYPAGKYPASTWVQVDRLFEEGFLVEVEVTAVLP